MCSKSMRPELNASTVVSLTASDCLDALDVSDVIATEVIAEAQSAAPFGPAKVVDDLVAAYAATLRKVVVDPAVVGVPEIARDPDDVRWQDGLIVVGVRGTERCSSCR